MAWPKTKKVRCISEIKKRLKQHPPMKALRMVSDVEEVPIKTLQDWFYDWKAQEKAKEAKKRENENRRHTNSQGKSASPFAQHFLSEPPAPPKPARLCTDTGQLRCTRCKGKEISRREAGYFCAICGKLEFEGWSEEADERFREHWGAYWLQ